MSGRATRSRSTKARGGAAAHDAGSGKADAVSEKKLNESFTQRKLTDFRSRGGKKHTEKKKQQTLKRPRSAEGDEVPDVDLLSAEREKDVKVARVELEELPEEKPETEKVAAAEPVVEVPAKIRALLQDKAAVVQYLKDFDLNYAYGPCVGLSRMERWERANKLELDPPKDVYYILHAKEAKDDVEIREPLWHDVL
ncbi:DNA polymerase delta, subunit 4-domain-containing protein [Fimicolochytrium jonesii]|uniref:DNA polymerase delta, subunit 4-domain-containing protein n=1 Tax=Fimicolochytrium jonesii TaxID=1396493 RepID=UPI0022FDE1D6|nr:DNA polymerase delta, subunit 4-domain-containing protein [Fimicolochytrium jonesii]KAI8821404.1 DNA polymerase delta, subunit 4-domain-containing protein [Fimicolochytrium jonesii]